MFLFFQAEDGRRGAHYGLEFRRVLFRSTGRFLAGVRALSAIRSALLLPLQERPKLLLQGRGWRIAGGSGVRELVLRRCRVQVPALLAGAVFARSVEAFEHRREVLLDVRSEEHTSELQSLMRISYAVFCLKKKNKQRITVTSH